MLYLVIWAGFAFLSAVAVARFIALDRHGILRRINAMTMWIFLPVYPALVVSVIYRFWLMTGLGLGLLIVHLTWIGPLLRRARPLPMGIESAPSIQIYSANILGREFAKGRQLEQIVQANPDLLLVQEFTPLWAEAFERTSYAQQLSFRYLAPSTGVVGLAIYSRFPISRENLFSVGGVPIAQEVIVNVNGFSLKVINLHPMHYLDNQSKWVIESSELLAFLGAQQGPTLAAGDLNISPHSRFYKKMRALEYRDSHLELGRGWACTWPDHVLFTPMRIDYVWVYGDLFPLAIREGKGDGSDHRPLIAEIALGCSQ